MNGNRKLLVAMTALVMAFVLGLVSKLTGEFVTVATVAVGAFTAGNAVEHWAKRNGSQPA